ncbi:MAG: outer membrane beta-barrel protein [Pararhizobium sp.]
MALSLAVAGPASAAGVDARTGDSDLAVASLRGLTGTSATAAPVAAPPLGAPATSGYDDLLLRKALGPTAPENLAAPPPAAAPASEPQATAEETNRGPAAEPVERRITRIGPVNTPERPIGRAPRGRLPDDANAAPGIRLGTFVLRPEVSEGIGVESRRFGAFHSSRAYLQTTLRGTLTSDWSRHQLTVTGGGIWQDNIAGSGETQPQADVSADLRLDLGALTTGHVTGSYSFFREDSTDPNALANAETQSTVNVLTGGASIERDLGLLRGSVSGQMIHTAYGAATLSDGTRISQSDRDTTAGLFKTRIGYAASSALVPFVQMSYLRTGYDAGADASGYRRSSDSYTAEAGVAADFGEKTSGELAAGYTLRSFEDRRLADIDGFAVDGTLKWSPRRGTDVSAGLTTAIEDSTTPGQSGPIAYALTAEITQEVRDSVVARIGAGYLRRTYVADPGVPDEVVYSANAGFTWFLTRTLGIDGDVSYERSRQPGSPDQTIAAATLGVTLRR